MRPYSYFDDPAPSRHPLRQDLRLRLLALVIGALLGALLVFIAWQIWVN
jgi:hypothetical protein